jgi:ribonuclease HI
MSINIYTDGSAMGNNNVTKDTPAGWGVVVVEGDTGDHQSGIVINQGNGRVITDHRHPLYIGAEVGSNNTAELTGIYRALMWCANNKRIIGDYGEVTIYSDSQYALNVVLGDWNASKNRKLVAQCKGLFTKVKEAGTTVNSAHIKAHSGFRWNERADQLAYDGANTAR